MAYGVYIHITHTGSTNKTLLLNDIYPTTDAPYPLRRAGPVYIGPGQTVALTYADTVSTSFERGSIRGFIDQGFLTAELMFGSATTFPEATGDITGRYPASVVSGIQSRPVSSVAPAIGDVIKWNGMAWSPAPASSTLIDGLVFVSSVEDLPPESGGVITLAQGVAYYFTKEVDLNGLRLACGRDTVILGSSSENCRIKSTGLIGMALITSEFTLPVRNVTIQADIALDLDALANPGSALDWSGVNFTDCNSIGRIANYNNVVMVEGAFLNSGGLTFDGTINTIAFDTYLFVPPTAHHAIHLPATLFVARRFRVIFSSFVVMPLNTGVVVDDVDLNFPANESFILKDVNFSGGGTYLSGISASSNKALFAFCVGIPNSSNNAQYYMNDNIVSTPTPDQNTFYKLLGNTSPGDFVSKFTVTENRATYVGALSTAFLVSAVVTFTTSSNNQNMALRVAKNGVTLISSEVKARTGIGADRLEAVPLQAVVSLTQGDFIEIWIANESSNNGSVVVNNMNVIIAAT
jgi:hypothetical protein